jgi:hypothetical protein
MTYGKKPAVVPGITSFSEVVDEACEKLMDKQISYSIRRIQKMEERLASLERELDDFLLARERELG